MPDDRRVLQAPHPERFDPEGTEGALIATEHVGRYWWAAQAVAGKEVLDAGCGVGYGMAILASAGAASVTGVDIDKDAVDEAVDRLGDAFAVRQGDLRDLSLPDDAFDVVVCWETIEHMEDGERAIGEFRRVLRPGGLLLISSPNPRVYPPGNEHHVHEYPPEELAAAVGEHFSQVVGFGQHAWLASAIQSSDGPAGAATADAPCQVRSTASVAPGDETYGIVVASDVRLPAMSDLVVLGSAFEVSWWSEQVGAVERAAREQLAATEQAARTSLERAENEARDALAEVARLAEAEQAALRRLRDSNAALLEAHQSLAQIPLLQHRMQDMREDHARQSARLQAIERSKSWRLMSPLRRVRRLMRFRR